MSFPLAEYKVTPVTASHDDDIRLQVDQHGNLKVTGSIGSTGTTTITGSVGLNATKGNVQPASNVSGTLNTIPLAQFSSGTITLTSGQFAPLQADRNGNLAVREQYAALAEDNANGVYATHPRPLSNATYSLSQFFSPQFTTGSVKATAGNVYSLTANNNRVEGNYFAIVNKASAGAAGDIPAYVKFVPASSSIDVNFPFGLACATGIGVAWSTQPNVVALPSSSTGLSANVSYL